LFKVIGGYVTTIPNITMTGGIARFNSKSRIINEVGECCVSFTDNATIITNGAVFLSSGTYTINVANSKTATAKNYNKLLLNKPINTNSTGIYSESIEDGDTYVVDANIL